MKFACDSCHTKYSISDDRVRGRVLKIRCKKCDFVITVREDAQAAAASLVLSNGDEHAGEAGAFASATEAAGTTSSPDVDDWYLSFDGEQEGPSSLAHALDRLRKHGKDVEVHAWRPGFLVWLPVEEVPELAVIAAKPAPRPPVRSMTPSPIGAGRAAGPLAQGHVSREPAGSRAALAVSSDLGSSSAVAARTQAAPPIPMAARGPVPVAANGSAPHKAPVADGASGRAASAAAVAPAPTPARDLFADSGPQSLLPDVTEEHGLPPERNDGGPDLAISNEASGLVNIAHLTAAAMGQKPAGPVFVNGHTAPVARAAAKAVPAPLVDPLSDPMLDGDAIEATTAPVPVVVMSGAAQGTGAVFKWAAGLFVLVSIGLGSGVVYLLTHRAPPETIIVTEPVRHGDDSPITVTDSNGTHVIVPDKAGKPSAGGTGQNAQNTQNTKKAIAKPGVPAATPTVAGKGDGLSGSQKALADLYKDDGDRATPHAIPGAGGARAGGGQVSNGAILATVSANKRTLTLCYERALKHDSSIKSGRVPIQVSVGISGRVTSVSIPEAQFASSELGQCFVQSVKRWNFPPSDAAYDTEFPFILQAQ